MGLATGLAIGSAAVGAAGGISKMIGGGKQKRAAKRALRQFKRQQLRNVQEGRGISTRGAEVALEQNARQAATSLETLASGGIRGVVGGVGAVQEQSNKVAQQVGAGLDQQQVQLQREQAQDEARIRAMQEQRENQELNQMYAQLNAGEQNQAGGLGDIAQAGFGAASLATSIGQQPPAGAGLPVNAKQTTAANPFGVTNPIFTQSPINPLTGQPY